MSQVAIQSYIGREYSVPFLADEKDHLSERKVLLKVGLNILEGDVWDKIKSHPMIKMLLETPHDFCISRKKIIGGDDKDSNYQTLRETYNINNEKHKKLECRDFRSIEVAPQTKKKD